jgi:2-haloacid dehalogenase
VEFTDFEALSFDCYGTLIDWETGIAAVLEPWARENGLELSRLELLANFGLFETVIQTERPGDLYPNILAECMRRIGEEVGGRVTEEDAARLASSVPDWPAFPDSPDALAELSQRYQLIILSNVDRASFARSNERLGVTFTSVITAEDVGSYKPAKRNFDALVTRAKELGIGDGRLLHVAQSQFHDLGQAKEVGLPTVWINRRQGGVGATPWALVKPDWQFPSMRAFADAVSA